jgi:hypothetical protein
MKRCLIFAPLVSHASSGRLAAIGATDYELYCVDTSTRPLGFSLDQYPFSLVKEYFNIDVAINDPLFQKNRSCLNIFFELLRSLGLLNENSAIVGKIKEVLSRVDPSVVVLFYGPNAMHFGRILKRIYPKLPLVLIHNLLPSELVGVGGIKNILKEIVSVERLDYSRWLRLMDSYIYASEEMANYAINRYKLSPQKKNILPDYFSKISYAKIKINHNEKKENVLTAIFLGAPERWGSSIDNLDADFLELTRLGISIFSGAMDDKIIKTGYGHKYNYFSDDDVFAGALSNYAHKFDVAIIAYGFRDRAERFRTTLPTRFFSAIAAGIPLAVKGGMFDAVEAYIKKYKIGFAYHDATDLKQQLRDLESMNRYRMNAIDHMKDHNAENQAAIFNEIFRKVILNA